MKVEENAPRECETPVKEAEKFGGKGKAWNVFRRRGASFRWRGRVEGDESG